MCLIFEKPGLTPGFFYFTIKFILMKTKFGAIVVDGRGKLGGHFFSKNIGGSFMGSKVTPSNPQSRVQFRRRKFFKWLTYYWRELTEVQRKAWNDAVPEFLTTNIFGDVRNPTGFELYFQVNYIRNEFGLTWFSLPPVNKCDFKLNSASVIVQINPNLFRVTFNPAIVYGMGVYVYTTLGLSPGRAFDKNKLHYLRDLANIGQTTYNIQTQYINIMGAMPPLGSKVYTRLQVVDYNHGTRGNFIDNVSICQDV